MAYTQNPGRSPLLKTGRDIPTPFLQTNISSGSDLKEKATAKAEKLRAADKSKLGTGETKTFTGTERNITPATTPAEVAAWKEAIKKPGAGRNIETETATVTKYGQSNLKPAGPVSPKNQISGTKTKPSPSKTPVPTGMSWTKSDTNQNFGGRSVTGMSPTGSAEIAAGKRKQSIDTDVKTISQGRPFSTGSENKYTSQAVTPREQKLLNRGLIGQGDNPIGVDPNRYETFLGKKEAIANKQDITIAERKARVAAKKTSPAKMKKKKC
jgi:hypothetical protein